MNPELLTFNGIDAVSGDYLVPPMLAQDLSKLAQGHPIDPVHLRELRAKRREMEEGHYGPAEGIDPKNLAETGWGVIFAHDADPAVREALSALLTHRKEQATQNNETYYKEFIGPDAYRPGESKMDFLVRHGVLPAGPANPNQMPYYLLIVGDPETIPYRFQYQLDVQYGVGRIHFDTPEEYANYARSVVTAETREESKRREAVFFAVRNPDDRATRMSADKLAAPLGEALGAQLPDWKLETIIGEGATKSRLASLMAVNDCPKLIFTASHGVGFPCADPRQLRQQGSLLCQDWPGSENWRQPIPQDFYFGADDIPDDAQLQGLIAVHFACYGLGTPQMDEFSRNAGTSPQPIAPHPFVAGLPKRLLGHPKGGALAVIGHVERAWSYSFAWPGAGHQIDVFESAFKRLMNGHPVGSATEYFNQRYAEVASDLTDELREIDFGKIPDDLNLAGMWTAQNDARNYVVLGDPAVRLR